MVRTDIIPITLIASRLWRCPILCAIVLTFRFTCRAATYFLGDTEIMSSSNDIFVQSSETAPCVAPGPSRVHLGEKRKREYFAEDLWPFVSGDDNSAALSAAAGSSPASSPRRRNARAISPKHAKIGEIGLSMLAEGSSELAKREAGIDDVYLGDATPRSTTEVDGELSGIIDPMNSPRKRSGTVETMGTDDDYNKDYYESENEDENAEAEQGEPIITD